MQAVWNYTTLQQVLKVKPSIMKHGMIFVKREESLNSCMNKMLSCKISSVPVIEDGRCVAIVDVKDVMRFLIKELEYIQEWTCWAPVKFAELMEGVSVKDIIDFAHGDPLLVADGKTILISLLKFFNSGLCHRCVVHLEGGEFGILSQIDVMHYLAQMITENSENLREILEKIPLSENLANRSSAANSVVSAYGSDKVINVLKLMYSKDVSAVAIVNGDDKLDANFSLSDILRLETASFSDLNLSVEEYLKKHSAWSLTPLAVQKEDGSLADAIVLFSAIGIHHLWIVDSSIFEKFTPIAIISLTDMFHMLSKLD